MTTDKKLTTECPFCGLKIEIRANHLITHERKSFDMKCMGSGWSVEQAKRTVASNKLIRVIE